MLGHDLHEEGEAFADLNDLNQQVSWVQKVLKQVDKREKDKNSTKGPFVSLQHRCGWICTGQGLRGTKLTGNQTVY